MIRFSVRPAALLNLILFLCLNLILTDIRTAHAEIGASEWFETEQTKVRLISATHGIGNSNQVKLGLQFKLKDNWKIYWRTPGDAGYPPSLDWERSVNLKNTQFLWPVPTRFQVLGLQTIGYKNEVIFPILATVLNPKKPLLINAELNYLTCDDICIPYKTRLMLDLSASNNSATKFSQIIDEFVSKLPIEGPSNSLKIIRAETAGELKTIEKGLRKGSIRLIITSEVPLVNPDVFIEGPELAVFSLPQITLRDQGTKAAMIIPVTEEETSRINETALRFTITDGQRSVTQTHPITIGPPILEHVSGIPVSLAFILGLALMGGIILNIMPCVLPVLSLKIMSFISQVGTERQNIRVSFVATSTGIVFSFFVIATGLVGLKLAGSALGWGIQFQQPWFIVSLTVIVSLFGYNLLGLFELNLPSWASNLAGRPILAQEKSKNFVSNFAIGAFATILATPCSAPFLGTAVGFALAGTIMDIYLVFSALGLGMALPYIFVAAFPDLAKIFPKPGIWMLRIKQLLGVALAATALWLIWVLAVQVNNSSAIIILSLIILIGAILSIKKFVIGDWHQYSTLAIILIIFGAILTPYYLKFEEPPFSGLKNTDHWVAFKPKRITSIVSQGKTVFVDITADWCVTCQVNKSVVLNRGEIFKALSKNENVVAMKGDWTRPNSGIANYLESYGRFGIPFNIVYGPYAKNGLVLPELLTAGIVRDALTKASNGTIFSKE